VRAARGGNGGKPVPLRVGDWVQTTPCVCSKHGVTSCAIVGVTSIALDCVQCAAEHTPDAPVTAIIVPVDIQPADVLD